MNWRDPLLRLLRVPPEPEAPPGDAPRVFQAAPNFLKLKTIKFLAGQLGAFLGLLFALYWIPPVTERTPTIVGWFMKGSEVLAWLVYFPQLILGLCTLRLDYEMRWYMVSNRAIRIREGVVSVREKTIALANVQNVALRQGPLQRLLGIADVEVRTAGGGAESGDKNQHGESEAMHIGYFRGVSNAEEIRDVLREGVRRQRDTGLGDPDEARHHADEAGDVDAAIAELLAAARALRGATG
jgi:membrane protein YdbS with pleckstrin-like domain